jgi:HSP20 family protein
MSLVVKKDNGIVPELVSKFWDAEKSLLSDFFDTGAGMLKWNGAVDVPAMNVIEHEKEFQIEMAVPGKSKEDFKVEVENNILKISCEKKAEKEEKSRNFRRHEFSFEQFSRSMMLPENSIADKLSAKYEHGILQLRLPKKEVAAAKPKKQVKIA